jgi:hypothetical protein
MAPLGAFAAAVKTLATVQRRASRNAIAGVHQGRVSLPL